MADRPPKPVPLPEAHWPDVASARTALLYRPIRLGPLQAEQRTWVPAMVPWRAGDNGEVTPDVLDWYGRFAAGQPGVLVAEATGIRDIPSGPLLRIGHDRFLPGLGRLVERVRQESAGRTRLLIQIIDFLSVRRRPTPARYFGRFWQVTSAERARLAEARNEPGWLDAPEQELRTHLTESSEATWAAVLEPRALRDLQYGYREDVNDTHLPQVAELPQVLPGLFADAAARAQAAGFDGVELHYAHAYTMASFLSRTNTRSDGYGGSRQNRVRLPLEILAAVRARVGRDWCLGLRFLGDEVIAGGSRIEDAIYFARRFAEAGVDFLSISKGGKFDDARQPRPGHAVYPYTGPSGHECMPTVRIDAQGPFARNVGLAAAIRAALRTDGHLQPIVTAGGLCTFEQAEGILQRGEADIIGSARQSLADPDWFLKVRLGRGAEVRRCVYTNYCEGLDQMHKQVTCKLWDKDFPSNAAHVSLSRDGRRRLLAPPWSP